MVKLSTIPKKPGHAAPANSGSNNKNGNNKRKQEKGDNAERKKAHLDLAESDYEFTTSVYGSKFAEEDLPTHEMPEKMMPREVAYRMIKDDLSLDNNPKLK